MTTRAVGPGRGWSWLTRAVNLGSTNAGAVFGGAGLMLALTIVAAIVLGLVMVAVQAAMTPGPVAAVVTSFVIMLPVIALVCALMVGYLRLIDAVESGRPAKATDVLDGFRDMGTTGRVFAFVVVLAIAQYVLLGGLIALLAPEFGKWYLEAMQASAAGGAPPDANSLPSGFGASFVVIWLISILVYAVQSIGIGQIALNRTGLGAALGDGVAGAFKNALPLLVLLLVFIGVMIVAVIAAMLVAMLLTLLGKMVGMWLVFLLAIPMYLVALLVMYVVAFGVMYFMWRDICGDGNATAIERDDQVEV